MKRISSIVLAILVLALPISAFGQTRTAITSQTLATATTTTTTKTLTSFSTQTYTITPDVFSRVLLPTGTGTLSLSTIAVKLGSTGTPILVGTATTLSSTSFGIASTTGPRLPTGGTLTPVKCDGTICSCTGTVDCRDMARANLCYGGANRNWWACDAKGCVCLDKNGQV